MAVMIIFENSGGYEPVRVTGRAITLGRSSKSHVQIKDSMCSGQHATLQLAPDGNVILTDLNSTNGTYVNETLVSTALRLFVDDVVRIGDTRFWIDGKSLTPKEAQVLRAGSNKTSFTKIELPSANDDKMSEARAARRKALGATEVDTEGANSHSDDDDHQEISVVFDQDQVNDAAKKKIEQIDDDSDIELEEEEKPTAAKEKVQPPKTVDDKPMSGVDVVFEMEQSSGKTKMIKLDRDSLASAKKKTTVSKKRVKPEKKPEGLMGKFKKIFGGDD